MSYAEWRANTRRLFPEEIAAKVGFQMDWCRVHEFYECGAFLEPHEFVNVLFNTATEMDDNSDDDPRYDTPRTFWDIHTPLCPYIARVNSSRFPKSTSPIVTKRKKPGMNYAPKADLSTVVKQMGMFADRNAYDALTSIYIQNGYQTTHFRNVYTAASAGIYITPATFIRLEEKVQGVINKEDGHAAIHSILEDAYELVFTGSRNIFLICNDESCVVGIISAELRISAGVLDISVLAVNEVVGDIFRRIENGLERHVGRKASRFFLDADEKIQTSEITLPVPKPYTSGLYKHTVGEEPKEILEGWLASESRCLLLWGIPGGGKSSFVSQMLNIRGYDNVALCDDTALYEHNSLITAVREIEDGGVVIFEDSDLLLKSRADGNKAMSALLNVISGVAERDIRFIFLTNITRLSDIDSALLRPGRTYKALEFKSHTPGVVNNIRTCMGMSELTDTVVNSKAEWTLAEIAHEGTAEGAKAEGFGFIRGM